MAATALLGSSLAASAVGGAISASSTLAGGRMANQVGQVTQQALTAEGASALASSQRQALDTAQRARLAISSSTARASASGVNAGTGSPAENAGDIAKRGSYQALMDMYNGESRQQALDFEGQEAAWEGQQKQSASRLAAAGTLAGSAGSMLRMYGMARYGSPYGRLPQSQY